MWPFSRRKRMASVPSGGSWYIGESTHQGRRMIVRKKEAESIQAHKKQLQVRLGVAVPFLAPDAHGMPGPEEQPALAKIEDLLCAEVERDDKGVHVLAITTAGMRELVFYVVDAPWAQGCVDRVRPQVPDYELQMYSQADPRWQVYSDFELVSASH